MFDLAAGFGAYRVDNVTEHSRFVAPAGHCHKHPLIALHDLDVMYGDRVIHRHGDDGFEPTVLKHFSYPYIAYVHFQRPSFPFCHQYFKRFRCNYTVRGIIKTVL